MLPIIVKAISHPVEDSLSAVPVGEDTHFPGHVSQWGT